MTTAVQRYPVENSFALAHQDRIRQEKAPRTLFSKGSEGLAVLIDVISLGRNSANAGALIRGAEAAAKVAPAIGGLVIAGGALAVLGGGAIFANSLSGIQTAYERGNWEKGISNSTLATAGASYSLAGAGMITAQSASFASAAAVAATATTVFTGAAFALYGTVGIYAGYNLAIVHTFRNRLNEKLANPGTEIERLSAALEWLRDQVSGETKGELNNKWDLFASRTSEACCRYVRNRLTPEFLEKVKNGDTSAINHAKWIVQEVKRDNGKQIAKNWLLMIIATLGTVALILSLLFAAGPLVPLLFAIGAGLWLLFDSSSLQEKFGTFICGTSQIPK